MQIILLLAAALGIVPFLLGWLLLPKRDPATPILPPLGSVLLCTLAFNLTFLWQELWLVIPKALTPGLTPILYHNDHDWRGDAANVELLQGTGAIGTLTSGVVALALLRARGGRSGSWSLFLFWMAFQGLFQALSQAAIGAVIAGNDVGRALHYLGVDETGRVLVLISATIAVAGCGWLLARIRPAGLIARSPATTREFATAMLLTGAAGVVLAIPFRLPRDLIEVVLIPAIVNLIGIGWLVLGSAFTHVTPSVPRRDQLATPAVALLALLALCQLFLRHGIAFR